MKKLPIVTAIVFICMTLGQLIQFEAFMQIMASYRIPPVGVTASFTILIVALQIAALPFLLRMHVSQVARKASALSLLSVPLVWLSIITINVGQQPPALSSGLFGDTLPIPVNLGTVLVSLGLVALSIKSFLLLNGLQLLPWLGFLRR